MIARFDLMEFYVLRQKSYESNFEKSTMVDDIGPMRLVIATGSWV